LLLVQLLLPDAARHQVAGSPERLLRCPPSDDPRSRSERHLRRLRRLLHPSAGRVARSRLHGPRGPGLLSGPKPPREQDEIHAHARAVHARGGAPSATAPDAAGAKRGPMNHLERYLCTAPISLALERAIEARWLASLPLVEPVLDVGCGDGLFAERTFTNAL